jgi:GT2 family glycosyltransferase
MISVIVPTFKSPNVLNLCLKSAIEGQQNQNQIIVVVDGFYDLNKDVLERWKDHIDILNMEENVGLCKGTNLGVCNAKYDAILIVNDDNVFPKNWDVKLLEKYQPGWVWAPNQIEPIPSMFPQFHIHNLGRTIEGFNLDKFWEYETSISTDKVEWNGSTLPIFMDKIDYLKVGGWDENYEFGMVADWDFFLKCQLSGFNMVRNYNCHFYHFVSLETKKNPKAELKRQNSEYIGFEYSKYKWGDYIKHNSKNNIKFIK